MNSFSGTYNSVPLHLLGGASMASPYRSEQAMNCTTFSSPPPPTISPRLIRVWLLTAVALGLLVEATGISWT